MIEREKKVLVVRPGPIGNTLAVVPALRALRMWWVDARISALVEKIGRETLLGCPYIDEFIVYEKRGEHNGALGWLKIVRELRKRKFTHVILSKRFFRMSFIARFTGAPVRVGFAGYGHKLTVEVTWHPYRSVIDTNLDLVEALGIPPAGRHLEIWRTAEDEAQVKKFLEEKGIAGHPFKVAIHAGGITRKNVLLPPSHWAEIALALEEHYGALPIFVGGKGDLEVIDEITRASGKEYINAVGLNIRATAYLISQCRFFMGNDSGPSHLAQAVNTPGIIYYGRAEDWEANIKRWKPEGESWIAVALADDGSHPAPRKFMLEVSELIHRISEREKIGK